MKMNLYGGRVRFADGDAAFSGGTQAEDRECGVSVMFCGSFHNMTEIGTGSDSAARAVLERYLKDGTPGFVREIDGVFAVAIYDRRLKRLLIARDRLGAMPMFYCLGDNGFYFAHTLEALRQNPAVPSEIDLQAIHDYLALQYVPCPRTLYRDVWKMRPGAILTLALDDRSLRFRQYWQPDFSQIDRRITAGEAIGRFRELLDAAVAKRIPASGRYAAFLSGGLDSTIITGIAARHTGGPLLTLTMGFDNPDYDERGRAELAVRAVNREIKEPLNHHVRVIEPDNFQLFKELAKAYGEPYADASLLPTHLLCRWAGEENISAAFNGDAADELFAGYERYLLMRYAGYFRVIPRWIFKAAAAAVPKVGNERSFRGRLLRTCRALGTAPAERYLNIVSRFGEERRLSLYGERFDGVSLAPTWRIIAEAEQAASGRHVVEKMQEVDMLTYMPGDVLAKAAIAAQTAGINALSPFLDNAVMDFAMTLPLKFKQNGFSRKRLLKMAYPEFVPPQIAGQRKKGFGVPVGEWLRGPWHELMCAHLLEGSLVRGGYCDRAGLERMIKSHQRREADYSYPLWSLTVLEPFL